MSLLAAAAAALALAACGGDDEGQASADENLCNALGNYASALAGVQALDASSTKGDIQEQTEAVEDAGDEVVDAAEDVEAANTDAIESAQDDLRDAIDGLSDDTTVAQARLELQPQLQALAQAYDETYSGLNCAQYVGAENAS
jgi:hypothetical protein